MSRHSAEPEGGWRGRGPLSENQCSISTPLLTPYSVSSAAMSVSVSKIGTSIATVTLSLTTMKRCRVS